MTRILAVETSGDYASAALLADGEVVCNIFKGKNRHTESLISLADEVLCGKNLKVADMDAVAFGAGPGAFTGLRVACGVAQGLAWAIGKPTVQVGNLAAAAYALFESHPEVKRVCVVNDARMHECYTASFERDPEGGMPDEVRAPELVKPEDVVQIMRQDNVQAVIGTALAAYAEEILVPEGVVAIETEQVSARQIVELAAVMMKAGLVTDPHLAAPLYVRNRVALTIEQRRAGERL